MIFKEIPDLWVYFSEISPDLRVVPLRYEWHNAVSWKPSNPPPPGNFANLQALKCMYSLFTDKVVQSTRHTHRFKPLKIIS